MAAGEIATVCGTIIQIATAVQALGNNWYKASVDWEDFPLKIARLQRKHDFWVKQVTRLDMLSDPSLMATLGEAEKLLEDEKAKLEKRKARCGAGCWNKVSRTTFPAKVGLRVQQVIAAFDAIPDLLQMEAEAAVALENRMMQRAPSLSFRDDRRYVPLKVTQSKVQEALGNPNVSPLVLLHGRPGQGKSTLARHLALHYQGKCKSPEGPFELVVFLECGPKADISTSQFKLAQLLGANTAATAVPEENGETGSDAAIRRRLSVLLKNQRIFIIFDDVWEREFLQEMLNLCGVEVKCLVTSQTSDLCRGLNLSHRTIFQIQIEDIKDDVAMQILASHVGFTDKQIPTHLQGQAQKMLEGAEGNPLALASVARGIDQGRSDQLVVWEAASQDFLKLLHSTDTAYTFGVAYSKSFWAATQLSIQAIKEGAQSLLILLHMCAAPSLPEEILRVLYSIFVIPGVFETFETSRKHLESRGLIKISSQTLAYDNDQKLYSWTLHSLQKLFIEHEVSDENGTVLKVRKDTMLKMLASQSNGTNFEANRARLETKSPTEIVAEDDSMLQLSLCSLYFQEQYLKTALKIVTRPHQLNSLRRNAIEPITRLLALPFSERWTDVAQASTKQIYLTYIYNSALHDRAILDLLAMPISVLPVLQALEAMATVESETTLIDENSGALLKALLDFLGNVSNTGDTTIARTACRVLKELSRNELHKGVIISSGILDTIVKILSSDCHLDIQVASTNILVTLTYKNQESKIKVVQHPRMLVQLLHSTSSNKTLRLRIAAGYVITNLTASDNDNTVQQLVNFPGLVEQLVNLLSQCDNDDIRWATAQSLENLAASQTVETRLKMMQCSGLQEKFFTLLTNDQFSQERAWPHYVAALTYVDPVRGNGARLQSAEAYFRRGWANMMLDRNKEALDDLNSANEIESGDVRALGRRCTVRARLGDLKGALEDCNNLIEKGQTAHNNLIEKGRTMHNLQEREFMKSIMEDLAFHLQERGVLKRMMGDFPGALADLNESLELGPNDYEVLKHRGFVRFLMQDETGAHLDAQMAHKLKPSRVDALAYRRGCLGTSPVEFLEYKLR